jgi:dTDP-glucose 4,6-dehydratase
MAKAVLSLMSKPEALLSYVKDRPGHDRRYALKCDKIERELGWKPAISLDAGLRQTIGWYQSNTEWIARVRDGAYRSYYQKYYENRDSSLREIAQTGPKPSH